jgi:hypothetical protein
MNMRTTLATLARTIALADSVARADEVPAPVQPELTALDDRQVSERLAYLEERLEYRQLYSRAWYDWWTTFYGIGIVVQSVQASLENDKSDRVDDIIGAVKATGGFVKLLVQPMLAKYGADRIQRMPADTRDERLQRLASAEEQLRINAKEADRRYYWLQHAANVGVNVAGALIVWQGFDDEKTAWTSAGIGIAVGEVMIWSQPWWPSSDWDEYRRRFSGIDDRRISWRIVPTMGGAAFQATF